ncbi:MAG: biotin transporter BioY [Candidatus Rhabdochlamydia sp.]
MSVLVNSEIVRSITTKLTSASSKIQAKEILLLIYGALCIAFWAQIKIQLPWTPVLFTGQTLGVMIVGAYLKSRRAALATLLYLIQGSLGMFVWANGASGILHLSTPVGGYYLAFILQAYLTGKIFEIPFLSVVKTALMLFLTCLITLSLGSFWMGAWIGWKQALIVGWAPFIPGEIVKCLLIALYLKK